MIGAAELAGDMTTRDISSLLFNNVYLYDGTPDNCCVLGFHSYDFEPGVPSNGNRERRYVMMYASWIDLGLFLGGFEDVTAYRHEMSETYTIRSSTTRRRGGCLPIPSSGTSARTTWRPETWWRY